jgi:hypothetical protein
VQQRGTCGALAARLTRLPSPPPPRPQIFRQRMFRAQAQEQPDPQLSFFDLVRQLSRQEATKLFYQVRPCTAGGSGCWGLAAWRSGLH